VDVRDAARALEILMEKAPNGSQYIISAENASFKSLLTQIAEELKVRPPFISLNPFVANVAIGFSSLSALLLNKKPLLTSEKYLIASTNFEYNNQKFVQDFNFSYLPLKQSIQDICDALEQSLRAGKKFGVLG
jgi:nucleoside-diphosphate-sugar epimerase